MFKEVDQSSKVDKPHVGSHLSPYHSLLHLIQFEYHLEIVTVDALAGDSSFCGDWSHFKCLFGRFRHKIFLGPLAFPEVHIYAKLPLFCQLEDISVVSEGLDGLRWVVTVSEGVLGQELDAVLLEEFFYLINFKASDSVDVQKLVIQILLLRFSCRYSFLGSRKKIAQVQFYSSLQSPVFFIIKVRFTAHPQGDLNVTVFR